MMAGCAAVFCIGHGLEQELITGKANHESFEPLLQVRCRSDGRAQSQQDGADGSARMEGRSYSVQARSEVLAMFNEGKGYRLAARRVQLPVSIVQTWYLDWKIGRFGAQAARRGRSYPPEIKDKALSMLDRGMSFSCVSEKLGVKRGTVYQWVRKLRQDKQRSTHQHELATLIQWSESSDAASVALRLNDLRKTIDGLPKKQLLKIDLEIGVDR